ncbi:hypothetical protein D3C72_2378650 [compost metagenome]
MVLQVAFGFQRPVARTGQQGLGARRQILAQQGITQPMQGAVQMVLQALEACQILAQGFGALRRHQ